VTGEPLSDARQTLLRALDAFDALEEDMGTEIQHVCVVYSIWKEDDDGAIHDNGGWNHTAAPAWLIAAMLRETAELVEASPRPVESDGDHD